LPGCRRQALWPEEYFDPMSNDATSQPDPAGVAAALVAWHALHQRTLPWRNAPAGARDPYQVWVSEIMLQQTRVETVIAYFTRWMARFPTLAALAAADQQAVLKAWEGLGYYARARNLHRAAQEVVTRHGGQIPADRTVLLALPGVGAYTAGALLSLAWNRHEPILDGNVKRVMARLWGETQPIDQPAVLKQLWAHARTVVTAAAPGAAGACNEAIMELGATVCTPQSPRCLLCPLADLCVAAATGRQAELPVMPVRKKTPHYTVTAGLIWQGEPGRSPLLIAQRPADKLLGGLWEFPGGKLEPDDADLAACLQREIREELAIEISVGAEVTVVEHAFTHFRITLHAFHARWVSGDWRWVAPDELAAYPFPVTDRRIMGVMGWASG
jgi:A/G-specific adenine glycosylase